MTPRRFDPEIVHSRLREIRALLDDLESVGEVTAETLEQDRITRHAVERILTQVVELAVAINSHLAAAFLDEAPVEYQASFRRAAEVGALPEALAEELAPSAGQRNILVHRYLDVDPQAVAEGATAALRAYRSYVREIATFVADRTEADGR